MSAIVELMAVVSRTPGVDLMTRAQAELYRDHFTKEEWNIELEGAAKEFDSIFKKKSPWSS